MPRRYKLVLIRKCFSFKKQKIYAITIEKKTLFKMQKIKGFFDNLF